MMEMGEFAQFLDPDVWLSFPEIPFPSLQIPITIAVHFSAASLPLSLSLSPSLSPHPTYQLPVTQSAGVASGSDSVDRAGPFVSNLMIYPRNKQLALTSLSWPSLLDAGKICYLIRPTG